MSKRCKTCGVEKPLGDFYATKGNRDGRDGTCSECRKQKAADRRLGPAGESMRAYDRRRHHEDPERNASTRVRAREWALNNPDRLSVMKAEWINNNPKARKAHSAVSNAIRDGRMVRGCCEVCGSNSEVHGHHDDYDKPLVVRWLCVRHHVSHHVEDRGLAALSTHGI